MPRLLRQRYQALLCGVFLLCQPGLALAHMPVKGMNNFYNGILHPLFIPAHVLVILALGLLLGQQKPRDIQPAIITFLLALPVALAGNSFVQLSHSELWLLVDAVLTGVLVIIARPLPISLYAIMALVSATLLGLDSGQQGLSIKEKTVTFLGSGISVYLLLLYATGFAEFFSKQYWQKIAVRVLGSWITASALLVLSLGLAPVPVVSEQDKAAKQDQGVSANRSELEYSRQRPVQAGNTNQQ